MATAVQDKKVPLLLRAKAALAKIRLEIERNTKEQEAAELEAQRRNIIRWLTERLEIPEDEIHIAADAKIERGAFSLPATVDGLTFQVRDYYEDDRLCVLATCPTCEQSTWSQIGGWHGVSLATVAAAVHPEKVADTCEHCREQRRITLPVEPPEPTIGLHLVDLVQAGEKLAQATERELEFQAFRGIRKDEAVRRIMQAKGIAATPAEKIVEEDEEYAAFLRDMRSSVGDRIRAETQYTATKISAQLAAKLAAVRGEES